MATDTLNVDCCIDKDNKVTCKLTVDASITVTGTFDGTSFTIANIDASSIFADCSVATLNVTGMAINNKTALEIVVTGVADCTYPGYGPGDSLTSVYSGNIAGTFTVPLVTPGAAC